MHHIFEEFEQIDKFRADFKYTFEKETLPLIKIYYPEIINSVELAETIDLYATHILNATQSVIDKDRNYPEYRIKEELENMTDLAKKPIRTEYNTEFNNELIAKVKALMVKSFTKIFDLSSYGFRLLEANAKVYNRHFIHELHGIINK